MPALCLQVYVKPSPPQSSPPAFQIHQSKPPQHLHDLLSPKSLLSTLDTLHIDQRVSPHHRPPTARVEKRLEFPRETGLILRCAGKAVGPHAGPAPHRQAGRLPSTAARLPGPRLPSPACFPSPPLIVSCFASLPVSSHSLSFCSFSLSLSLHVYLSLFQLKSLFCIFLLSSGLSLSLYLSVSGIKDQDWGEEIGGAWEEPQTKLGTRSLLLPGRER